MIYSNVNTDDEFCAFMLINRFALEKFDISASVSLLLLVCFLFRFVRSSSIVLRLFCSISFRSSSARLCHGFVCVSHDDYVLSVYRCKFLDSICS